MTATEPTAPPLVSLRDLWVERGGNPILRGVTADVARSRVKTAPSSSKLASIDQPPAATFLADLVIARVTRPLARFRTAR